MTKKPVSNVGASVRQRLLNLRDQTGEDAQALFIQFAIERFLYRLSRSSVADRFVLKGAMLFRVWSGSLHRPTKDVDLLGFGEPAPASVAAMIHQIINTAVEDDGITFDAASIRAEEIRENDDYNFGYNAQTEVYEDLVAAGVIDPAKVTRSALQNAASIAGLMLTTEAMVCEIPEKKSAPAGGGHGPEGMDY